MRVRIEHEIRDTRGTAGIERLLETFAVKSLPNSGRADHRNRFSTVARRRNESRRFPGFLDDVAGEFAWHTPASTVFGSSYLSKAKFRSAYAAGQKGKRVKHRY